MTERSERRAIARKAAKAPAWADPGGVLPVIDCRIVDLSEQGARVVGPLGGAMPAQFRLQIDSSRILGAAEVVWREAHCVGVRFLERS